MKTGFAIILATAACLSAQTPKSAADKLLLDFALRDEGELRLDRARLALQTLIQTYPESPSASQASRELAAITLYTSAQSDLAASRSERARLALQTLLKFIPIESAGRDHQEKARRGPLIAGLPSKT